MRSSKPLSNIALSNRNSKTREVGHAAYPVVGFDQLIGRAHLPSDFFEAGKRSFMTLNTT